MHAVISIIMQMCYKTVFHILNTYLIASPVCAFVFPVSFELPTAHSAPVLLPAASSVLRLQFLGSCQQCFGARTDGSAVLSAVLSISHLNTSPQEGNRSPAKLRSERDREKEREASPPHLQLFPGRKL